jgi:hypothetical protein
MQAKAVVQQETIRFKGKPIRCEAVRVNNQTFFLSGKVIRTASLRPGKDQWQQDVKDPEAVIQALKSCTARVDLFKFWQRIPESTPKYQYYREWRDIAAIPVTTFKNWWDNQISSKTRNMVRKSQKFGVSINTIELSDRLIRGIVDIFNESPVRRGKFFWHYGRGFASVKEGMSADSDEAIFISAYYGEELIGFIKLLLGDRCAMISMILDKTSHRDKSPMNGMIAKAVEVCANRSIPYLIYTVWRRGDHGDFQKRNGFVKFAAPEYYVPLTFLGGVALRFRLHRGLKTALPERIIVFLLALRSKWYAFRYRKKTSSTTPKATSVGQPLA